MSETTSAPIVIRAADAGSAAPPPTREVEIVGTPRRIEPGRSRSGARPVPVAAADDDVVRIEYENGLVFWSRADDLLRECGTRTVARDGTPAAWEIDASPRPGLTLPEGAERGERGLAGLGIRVLELFGVDLKQKSAALLGRALEERQLRVTCPGSTAARWQHPARSCPGPRPPPRCLSSRRCWCSCTAPCPTSTAASASCGRPDR